MGSPPHAFTLARMYAVLFAIVMGVVIFMLVPPFMGCVLSYDGGIFYGVARSAAGPCGPGKFDPHRFGTNGTFVRGFEVSAESTGGGLHPPDININIVMVCMLGLGADGGHGPLAKFKYNLVCWLGGGRGGGPPPHLYFFFIQ